eukprot:4367328-Pyramimonas_sp.AAC.1
MLSGSSTSPPAVTKVDGLPPAPSLSNLSKTDQKLSHCPFCSGRPTSSSPRRDSCSSSMPKSSTRYDEELHE